MFALRILAVWFAIMGVEFLHGLLRAIFLVPAVGDFRARQIGVATGSFLIVAIASFSIRWLDARRTREQILTGLVWLVLTLSFEWAFGHFVFGRSWQDLAADYDIPHGGFLPFGMIVLMFSPLLAARLRPALDKTAKSGNYRGDGLRKITQ